MVHVIARSDDKKHNLDEDNLSEHLITSDSVPAHSLGDINQTRPTPLVHPPFGGCGGVENLKTDSFISSSILYDNTHQTPSTPVKHFVESHLVTISPL